MENCRELYYFFLMKIAEIEQSLQGIEKELQELDSQITYTNIFIKNIQGRLYYYGQWYEGKRLVNKSLGRVSPGSIADMEMKIERYQELKEAKEEKEELLRFVQKSLERLKRQKENVKKADENYTFEVYWKNEIASRVYVRGEEIRVTRLIKHPVKQIFAKDKMTRHQLNTIFLSRCWDPDRRDSDLLLKGLGLETFNPREIVRRTHGVMYNDFIWFRFPGENLRAEDVLCR